MCFSQHSRSLPPALPRREVQDELEPGRRRLPGRGGHTGHLQTAGRRTAGKPPTCSMYMEHAGHGGGSSVFCSAVLTAGDASVCGRLDGGRKGGVPHPLPVGQLWSQPRGPGYLQRTGGPEQQVRRLLLQAQRFVCTQLHHQWGNNNQRKLRFKRRNITARLHHVTPLHPTLTVFSPHSKTVHVFITVSFSVSLCIQMFPVRVLLITLETEATATASSLMSSQPTVMSPFFTRSV